MMEYNTEQWFNNVTSSRLLSSKILMASVDQPQVVQQTLTQPVSYHISALANLYAPRSAQCVYYDVSIQSWSTSAGCQSVDSLLLGIQHTVDCTCQPWAMAYAVLVDLTVPSTAVGYTIWFEVSCFVTIIAMVSIISTHHLCAASLKPMFTANLHIHLCFAIFATQVCYVVDTFISPGVLFTDASSTDSGCIVISLVAHYFYISQFTCLLVQVYNMYQVLILNDEQTDRLYIKFAIFSWGFPAVCVGLFYIITYLLYRYTTHLPVEMIYGDVNDAKEICFITNIYAAIGGVITPSIISCLIATGVMVYIFRLSLVWQFFSNIYRNQTNIRETKLLAGFWLLMAVVYLWAGLHMAYQRLWLLILLCIFNISLGIYALIAYVVIRLSYCNNRQQGRDSLNSQVTSRQTMESNIPDLLPLSVDYKEDTISQLTANQTVEEPNLEPVLHVYRKSTLVNKSPALRRGPRGLMSALTTTEFDDVITALRQNEDSMRQDRELTEISYSGVTPQSDDDMSDRQWISLTDTTI